MTPQPMTNEQFALWIAMQMIHSNLFEKADIVYEWLDNKKQQRIVDYNAGYDDASCNHINDAENYVNESNYVNRKK